MRILVLGAAGFVGSRLVRELGNRFPQAQITASDLRAPVYANSDTAKNITIITGDVQEQEVLDALFAQPVDVVFHLAATLTIDAENSFEQGVAVNVHALMRILEACRAQDNVPKFIFTSSVSTFGGALPDVVDDYVRQTPQTSYGTHKLIGEQLINDYSRRNFLDGRALRLPIILTHPGPATASVSDRIASLIREPLSGMQTICPIGPDTPLAVASVDTAIDGLIGLMNVAASAFTDTRAMNMPALTITPAQIAEAVDRRLPKEAKAQIEWEVDPSIQKVVENWPSRFTSALASQLGLVPDASADAIVDAYLSDRDGRKRSTGNL